MNDKLSNVKLEARGLKLRFCPCNKLNQLLCLKTI